MEAFYPLRALVCGACFLVQLEDHGTPHEIFSDYAYFSSYSSSWLDHSRLFAERMVERFELGGSSSVVELASNDGYLLQYFAERGIPVLGIEPAANVAEVARERGIPTRVGSSSGPRAPGGWPSSRLPTAGARRSARLRRLRLRLAGLRRSAGCH